MPEQSSVIELQKTFEDMVGFRANAKISEEGAFASAEKIVDLDEKLVLKTTAPIDLYSAVLATSQCALSGRSDSPGIGGERRSVAHTVDYELKRQRENRISNVRGS